MEWQVYVMTIFSALITHWDPMILQMSCWKSLNSWVKTMKKSNLGSFQVKYSSCFEQKYQVSLWYCNYLVLENVENGKICDFVAGKIMLLHNYARNTLHKCSAGYELDGNENESIRLKKGIESLKRFLFRKLRCS